MSDDRRYREEQTRFAEEQRQARDERHQAAADRERQDRLNAKMVGQPINELRTWNSADPSPLSRPGSDPGGHRSKPGLFSYVIFGLFILGLATMIFGPSDEPRSPAPQQPARPSQDPAQQRAQLMAAAPRQEIRMFNRGDAIPGDLHMRGLTPSQVAGFQGIILRIEGSSRYTVIHCLYEAPGISGPTLRASFWYDAPPPELREAWAITPPDRKRAEMGMRGIRACPPTGGRARALMQELAAGR